MGQIQKRGRIWWVRYYRDGRRFEARCARSLCDIFQSTNNRFLLSHRAETDERYRQVRSATVRQHFTGDRSQSIYPH